MWIIEHEEDVASDLSAFHRVDDPMTLDGPRYFSLAMRLGAYAGVMQARAIEARQDERGAVDQPTRPAAPTSAPGAREQRSRVSDDTALAMLAAEGWAEHEKGVAA